MLCLIESIHNHKKIYCSFVYASNFGMERRGLWKELLMAKICTSGNPWVLMGDFNVTLNVSKHSAGKSTIDVDMEDFLECVNNIEMEDVCSTRMYFTWIKSPKKPSTSVMKKLDRVMANDLFMDKYNQAYAIKEIFYLLWRKDGNLKIQVDDEVKLLYQMVKIDWLNEGDMNSAYFHKVVKSRKSKNRILSIKSKAGIIVEGKKVVDEFVNHFEVFLGQSSPVKSIEEIGNIFTSKLTTEEAFL
ncbi:RNA-directed DNA polymerase, eukaryota, reverse transcriptase zinc-binding domain protein [Tanacetum coccineum]